MDGRLAITRRRGLEAEQHLFSSTVGTSVVPVVVRSGAVYGREVKLIRAARRLMRLKLMAVWPGPTWYHFIALEDFLRGLEAAIRLPGLRGVYPLGDDRPLPLQAFADRLADHWGFHRPWRLPPFAFESAATLVELAALAFGSPAPLTRDIIKLGRVDHAMDTRRMKADLLPDLVYPSLDQGIALL